MKYLFSAAFAAMMCSIAFNARAVEGPKITPEMYGALPAVADAAISPDGKTLATLRNDDHGTLLAFHDLTIQGFPAKAMRLGTAKAREIQWANNDRVMLLVSVASRQDTEKGRKLMEFWRWVLVSRADMKSKMLFRNEKGYFITSPGTLLSTVPGDDNRLVFSRWSPEGAGKESQLGSRLKTRATGVGISLFSVQVDTGEENMIAGGNEDTEYWVANAAGKPMARVDRVDANPSSAYEPVLQFYTRDAQGEFQRSRVLPVGADASVPYKLEGLSAANGKFIAKAVKDGREVLLEYDPGTGTEGTMLGVNPEHDVDAIYDTATASVSGYSWVDDLPRRHYFDPERQRMQASLAKAMPDASPQIWSSSEDGKRHVVKVEYDDHPPQWFLYDVEKKSLDILASTYEALDGTAQARKEKFDYLASDGVKIPGYLTVPEGVAKRNLPLIVLPHGGPAARDDGSFDWWAFFYAARGYLVYQPNFRGSTGYGVEFERAGNGQWGKRMQDDISEGVRKLIADGVVDRKRICIVGASYGGYAALAGAVFTPDLYACVVSVAGVANVRSLFETDSSDAKQYWEGQMGTSRFDRETLATISPLNFADRVRAPVLLIHGKDDTVVSVSQSRAMAKALQANGKSAELVELDGEDHWLSNGTTRTQMLVRSIGFIDRCIGGTPVP